jgi:hypothetical protein
MLKRKIQQRGFIECDFHNEIYYTIAGISLTLIVLFI